MRRADPELIEPAIQAVVERVAALSAVVGVILFGSRARGDHHADSDWDLCVIVRDDAERAAFGRSALRAVAGDTGAALEWHAIRRSDYLRRAHVPGWLAHEVAEDGVLLAGAVPMAATA